MASGAIEPGEVAGFDVVWVVLGSFHHRQHSEVGMFWVAVGKM